MRKFNSLSCLKYLIYNVEIQDIFLISIVDVRYSGHTHIARWLGAYWLL